MEGRLKSGTLKEPVEMVVRGIRRAKFKRYSSEEKIRIVLEGLRGERQRWREIAPSPISAPGHERKSRTTILMSVKPPKAEVTRRRWHFRYVPCVDGSVLARVFLNAIAVLVGAAMCSAC